MDALSALRHDQHPAPPIVDLLRSLGIADPNLLRSLAVRLPAPADIHDPTRAARIVIGQWFARVVENPDVDAEDAFRLGRAAFVALDGGSRWAGALLDDSAPAELRTKLRQYLPRCCPAAAQTVMLVQPLDPPVPMAAIAGWFRGRAGTVRPA
jgi:hypothetical protein